MTAADPSHNPGQTKAVTDIGGRGLGGATAELASWILTPRLQIPLDSYLMQFTFLNNFPAINQTNHHKPQPHSKKRPLKKNEEHGREKKKLGKKWAMKFA